LNVQNRREDALLKLSEKKKLIIDVLLIIIASEGLKKLLVFNLTMWSVQHVHINSKKIKLDECHSHF